MKRFVVVITLCLSLLFVVSCSNDLETNIDAKETMIIYSLLNINDSVHYVRVNRAFVTNNRSALEIAKINDSLYFDSVEVKIDAYENSGSQSIYKATYLLRKDLSQAKDTGIFANYPNILYSVKEKLFANYSYVLTVTNKRSGNVAKSTTTMVDKPVLNSPSLITTTYNIDTGSVLSIRWNAGKNARIYDVIIRFYWDEHDSITNQVVKTDAFVDWSVIANREPSSTGTSLVNIAGIQFYTFLAAKLPHQIGKYRVAKKIDFLYWSADDAFYTYRLANQPSVGIVQKLPEYTTISNGNYGLFASRNLIVIPNVSLTPRTITALGSNSLVRHLKFR